MKYWNYSLWLGVFSLALLTAILMLPASFSVFVWNKVGVDAGILFPFLMISWVTSVVSVAYNNIFIDRLVLYKGIEMRRTKRYLPSLLSMPALISFVWFCYRWYRGNPNG